MTARHVIVHGRVQGVFYRDWTVETATELGLGGWVRNLPDGTVEAYFEGDAEMVGRMIEAMHAGSLRARVERIRIRNAQPQGMTSFQRR
ncbi:acylphosphatase [Qipengyuania sp. MTN3-11]|uniref:acylphosphatase n=1 Tax=Qipengyuania sp. MTN3-11 TaxID=3056557 RepID=UPI0036F44743